MQYTHPTFLVMWGAVEILYRLGNKSSDIMFFEVSTMTCTYNGGTRCLTHDVERVFTMGKFATFLVGGIVGAAAGLLLSPRTGAENRAKLSETLGENCKIEVPSNVQEKAGQFVDAAASTSQKVINTVIDNGSDAYKAVVSRASQANPTVQSFNDNGDELRQKIDAARERIATQVAKNAETARDAAVDKIPVVIDAAQGAAQSAKSAAQTASQAVTGAAATAKDTVVDAAATVTSKINSSSKGAE